MAAVSASNEVLPLFAILKGKRLSPEVQELQNHGIVITATINAWMTEEAFLLWITNIWEPYSSQFDRSLLLLDHFRVHLSERVLAELERCKTDVLLIPKGLTFMYQPCDVYVNRPLKDNVRRHWREFMIQQNDLGSIIIIYNNVLEKPSKPKKEQVIRWVDESLRSLDFVEDAFFSVILRGFEQFEENFKEAEDCTDSDNELIYEEEEDEIDEEELSDLELM